MINKFDIIKNLGVFSDFKHPANLPKFERFNLIYGTNGSGKTTLSRFFNDLNSGNAIGFPDLKYTISAQEGKFTHGQPYVRSIRVFNSEYVENNIGEIEGQLNPIFIIGEDNKTLASQLQIDEKEYDSLEEKILVEEKENGTLLKKRSKQFTDIARIISQDTAGTSSRTYNKKNAESAYDKLEKDEVLSPQELADAIAALKQTALNTIDSITIPSIELKCDETEEGLFSSIETITNKTENIVQDSATSLAIGELLKNPELAAWVEKGRDIHVGKDTCQYCLQEVSISREKALAQHFNDSDKQLKSKILAIKLDVEKIKDALRRVKPPRTDSLYKENHEEFSELRKSWDTEIEKFISYVQVLDAALDDKLLRRTESYKISIKQPEIQKILDTIMRCNEIIQDTNKQSAAYENRIKQKQNQIETHHLSIVRKTVSDIDKEIQASNVLLDTYRNGNASDNNVIGSIKLKERIDQTRITLSNSHKGASDLSQKLASFLGRDDLKFVAEDEGYRIERFGRPAQKLSEGEKTAITFLHFVVGLKDQDFNLSEGIVVIDDPISSLDAASVYQAFGFLKTAVKDAKQVFLMTHNFDFLKLLLNWIKNEPKKDKTYLMLKCIQNQTSRETTIIELDEILKTANNEYEYLFKILREFQSDGTVANSYHIPNVIRKVLETFLGQYSYGKTMHQKLANLNYDEQKKTALNKYANDLSHPTYSGIDPALVGETQTNVGIVIKMIEDVSPLHFKALLEKTSMT